MKIRLPHPLVLLVAGVVLAAVATWVLPAGRYQRHEDPLTKRQVVTAGTYAAVDPAPVGPFAALVALPKGMEKAGDVIFFIFLVGGAFAVVDRTGALASGVERLVRALRGRPTVVIPVVCLLFGAAGALENMQEELLALVPVLVLLTARLGAPPVTAAAMSLGAAAVGAAFSPINPFQVGIAQKLAGLPLLSGAGFRLVVLAIALILWTMWTVRHALRHGAGAIDGTPAAVADGAVASAPAADAGAGGTAAAPVLGAGREAAILGLMLVAFAVFIVGVASWGWGFNEMAALFFVMGVAAGVVGRLGLEGTAEAFAAGFRDMALAAMLIGVARGIYVVLDEGRVIDTVVHGLFQPLSGLPVALSAVAMMLAQKALHVIVPSVSGQAVLSIPILSPLSDLLGLSRQVTVLAFQYGGGLCDALTPTNGALMAFLAATRVRYEVWLRFLLPVYLLLTALGVVAIVAAIAIGLV